MTTKHLRVILIALVAAVAGCSTTPNKWGADVSLQPGWTRFEQAVSTAIRDPGTWIPATATVLALASGKDESFAQDALRENWVYGSKRDAAATSDEHAELLKYVWWGSVLITDSGDDWVENKAKGFAVQGTAVLTSNFATNKLKKAIRRREPDPDLAHVEYEAFPSNHATPQFTQAAMIRRNLAYTNIPELGKGTITTVSYLLASSSAYGRVEAGLHRLSDQLAGAALGNFIGVVMHETFMQGSANQLTFGPANVDGWMAWVSVPLQ